VLYGQPQPNQHSPPPHPTPQDVQECLLDLREHDVPYHVRFAIDTDVRAGHWYEVKAEDGRISLHHRWAGARRGWGCCGS